METQSLQALGVGALVSALSTRLLLRLAPRLGWLDAPVGPAAARKLQSRAVPPVGGTALLVSLVALALLDLGPLGSPAGPRPGLPIGVGALSSGAVWLSLLSMFVVGLTDDCLARGLRPLPKLLGQAAALLPLAWAAHASGAAAPTVLALFAIALVAVNVLNTFDNADGAVTLLACVGWGAPAASGSVGAGVLGGVLGFLPFNVSSAFEGSRRPVGERSSARTRAPLAYLGDSGAFLLALLMLLHPTAWLALWIPGLDLARLNWVRWSVGSRPWIGDRRHLAHRLQAKGLGPLAVAGALALLALPGCLAAQFFPESPAALGVGLAVGAIGYFVTLNRSRPCPEGCASE